MGGFQTETTQLVKENARRGEEPSVDVGAFVAGRLLGRVETGDDEHHAAGRGNGVLAETLHEAAAQHDVTLRTELKPCRVHGIAQIVDELVYKLCDNAIKYNTDGGRGQVTVTKENETAAVTVRDTGIGIPKDSQKKIFERFYKTDLSRGKDKKGTGLGLAIVKEIIQAHGENIDVVSTEGVGTEFIFSLPKATAL